MSSIPPNVRHMLLCDDVRPDPENPGKLNVLGLVSSIRSTAEPPFPLRHPQLCLYLQVTEGRGKGNVRIVVREADSEVVVSATPPRELTFAGSPLSVAAMLFRVQDCVFPRPGLYWVQFCFGEQVLAQEPLLVR
jgi:hypothetical protein